jgi:26S proteasome regulatory subunit N2
MYTIGLAYVGTGQNSAVKRLLHVAVSDVSDDVRRAAVTNLGFLLYRQPDRLPPLVALLAESYNPHVRYGSALALGIALAGRAGCDAGATALALLERMHSDVVDFVRQGSLVASAMILMQQPDVHPSVKPFREKIASIVREKHPSTMTKVGAIMAHGLLDAGGRNVTLSLSSRAGFTKATAVVGLALWAQHWYWYPLQYMLGLSFSPTALIGLNKDFDMPTSFSVTCAAKPSLFAYPKMTEAKKEEKKERVATVLLSTTARAKAREARKEKLSSEKSEDAKMGDAANDEAAGEADEEKGAEETEDAGETVESKKKGPEPTSFELSNPSRVTPEQELFVSFNLEQRYVPINPRSKPAGIVILIDRNPDEPDDVVQVKLPSTDSNADEAAPPEPFEWSPDMQSQNA